MVHDGDYRGLQRKRASHDRLRLVIRMFVAATVVTDPPPGTPTTTAPDWMTTLVAEEMLVTAKEIAATDGNEGTVVSAETTAVDAAQTAEVTTGTATAAVTETPARTDAAADTGESLPTDIERTVTGERVVLKANSQIPPRTLLRLQMSLPPERERTVTVSTAHLVTRTNEIGPPLPQVATVTATLTAIITAVGTAAAAVDAATTARTATGAQMGTDDTRAAAAADTKTTRRTRSSQEASEALTRAQRCGGSGPPPPLPPPRKTPWCLSNIAALLPHINNIIAHVNIYV